MSDPRSEEDLFEAARRLPDASARAAFLDSACAADVELRQRVEDLLSAEREAEQLFRPLSPKIPPTARNVSNGESVGAFIGRYKLLEKIGEGGFGIVYLAEQEEPVKRRVALKIIKLGMDTKQVVARFEAERQTLALMDHPNIAKVHDGGATETGRPYFVMELVRGISITQYCDENQLSPRERLQLSMQVCSAVQHAHQKGIIHRDLKPSNILVTVNDGLAVPKVIDFGVAKATQQELTEKTIFTQFHQLVGTPAYMSPEQAQMTRVDIDTRSDIYALGVLLYELTTGKTPFDGQDLMKAGFDEMRRIIRETEPLKPSTRVTQEITVAASRESAADSANANSGALTRRRYSHLKELVSLLRGDLDWIVMKCLEKDRSRRYETANALAADIQRHLSNEPVIARPPSSAYRVRKYIRRNRIPVAAAMLALTALTAAVAVSSWQAVKAKRAEQDARKQAALAKEQARVASSIKNFLTEQLLGTANPFIETEPDPNKRPLLERIDRQLEGKFPDQPLIEAEIRFALGDAFKDMGEWAKAAPEFERCLQLRRQLLTLRHSDTQEAVAGLADAYVYLGKKAEAQALLSEAIVAAPGSPDTLPAGAGWVLREQGFLLFRDGRSADAVPFLKNALTILKRSLNPEDRRLKSGIGVGLLAHVLHAAGKREEAEAVIAEALQESEQNHQGDAPLTALLERTQAYFLLQRDRPEQALRLLERSLAIQRPLLGPNNHHVLESEYYVGLAHEQMNHVAEAARIYAALYPRWTKHFPFDLARSHCSKIAQFFVKQRRLEEAKAIYRSVSDSFERNPPQWSWESNIVAQANAVLGTDKQP